LFHSGKSNQPKEIEEFYSIMQLPSNLMTELQYRFDMSLILTTGLLQYSFTGLVHRDETLNFLDYLNKNVPYYVEPPTPEEFETVIEENLPPPDERPVSGNYNGRTQKSKVGIQFLFIFFISGG
jgi:hypothetical protein